MEMNQYLAEELIKINSRRTQVSSETVVRDLQVLSCKIEIEKMKRIGEIADSLRWLSDRLRQEVDK